MGVSAYSLVTVCRNAEPVMNEGGSIFALTYLGSVLSVPGYNVMGVAKAALESSMRFLAVDLGKKGVRVNCLSSGPVKTLAAMGISGFSKMLKAAVMRSPMKRNVALLFVAKLFVPPSAIKNVPSVNGTLTHGLSDKFAYYE